MAAGTKVVVDGSNIATEGRSAPSLAQLDEAVRAYLAEHPKADITVVVDATFGHRIDDSERQLFEEARAAGEMVSPPAGAIGRGDAFLLRIAEKTGATVLSNDSFQEFHGEHDWLFTTGRLIGGVPVAGVGWIFTPRSPVRGPKSRQSVQEAKREQKRRGPRAEGKAKAIAEATQEVSEAASGRRRRRRRGRAAPSDPLNEPLPFLTFVSAHPLGTEVDAEVEEFSSHGAFVTAGDVRCYVPLSALGDPPPRAAREVLNKGEKRAFVVQALDPQRRGIELALPGHAHVAGAPTSETVEAEIKEAQVVKSKSRARTRAGESRRPAARVGVTELPADAGPEDDIVGGRPEAPSKDPARRAGKVAKKAVKAGQRKPETSAKEATAKKATAGRAAKTAPAKQARPKSGVAAGKKPTPFKSAEKVGEPEKLLSGKAAVKKKASAKKATTKSTSKKSPAKKTAAKKNTGAKKAPAKKTTAKKTPARKSAAKKTTAKKSAANKAAAKKTTAKKSGATKKSGAKKSGAKKATSKKGTANKR